MYDYIIMERIWQDTCFFKMRVTCKSKIIYVQSDVYTANECMDDLYEKLRSFVNGTMDEVYWLNGDTGDDSTPCISLRFIRKDRLGHILIEVYMELDDGGTLSKHNCCFFINTELGLLDQFTKSLVNLKESKLGVKVILNQLS